ncbi:MAG: hypothetical protein M1542_07665 [Thermotogae bacterium]|nr:hypothetical protein [Thermotogota bacterium]
MQIQKPMARKVQKMDGNKWVDVPFEQLKLGDKFRFVDKNGKASNVYEATSNPIPPGSPEGNEDAWIIKIL